MLVTLRVYAVKESVANEDAARALCDLQNWVHWLEAVQNMAPRPQT